jgi:hypothetical protein
MQPFLHAVFSVVSFLQLLCRISIAKRFPSRLVLAFPFIVSCAAFGQATQYYSLLIGVNNGTGRTETQLSLNKMVRIASQNDHYTIILSDELATRKNILDTLKSIGAQIGNSENIGFLFYFNGYGREIDDYEDEEQSVSDNAVVVYDGVILDDEITAILRKDFKKSSNVMIIDIAYSEASISYSFLFLDFSLGLAASRYKYEVMARNRMSGNGLCSSFNEDAIVGDFSLVYVGSGGLNIDRKPATNNMLTYWLSRIYSNHRRNNRQKKISYRNLFCDLRDKMISHGQPLQYFEIGKNASVINNGKPF